MKIKALCFLCLAAVTFAPGFSPPAASAQQKISHGADAAATAAEILEKNLAALGGREVLAAVKSVEIEAERQVLGRTIKSRRVVDLTGNRSYNRQESPNGIIESGYDGKRAWQKAPFFRGYLDANSPQARALSRNALGLPGGALYNFRPEGGKFERLPDEQLGGKNYLVVKSSRAGEDGREIPVKFYLDPASFLLKQVVTGDAIRQTETFDDYRRVEGITVAFSSGVTNPQASVAGKITALKFNAPFDPSLFEFREPAPPATAPSSPATTAAKTTAPDGAAQVNGKTEPAAATAGSPGSGVLSEALRLEAFETVWKTVEDTFYDRTFNGVDWRAVRERYLPQVKAATGSADYHKVLNRMVQELHLSHFNVVPPERVVTLASGASGPASGSPGLGLKWVENQLIVSAVAKDSPAMRAGIRPGFVVARVNGKTPEELYDEYRKNNPGFRLREELARVRAAAGEMVGKPDSKVSVEMLDARDAPLQAELARETNPTASGGGSRRLAFESKKLGADVGYVKFNIFFGDLLPKFEAALKDLGGTKTLIIDLRGNPGGAGDLAPALADLLSPGPGTLGSLTYRYETTQYSYKGTGGRAYRGKIVILTDEGTGSTSEVFAAGLQANGRAVVVGSQTAGAVLPSMVKLLPTGGVLQYVVSNFQTPDGVTLEGKGVTPDVAVKLTRADLLGGRDPVLAMALKLAGKRD